MVDPSHELDLVDIRIEYQFHHPARPLHFFKDILCQYC